MTEEDADRVTMEALKRLGWSLPVGLALKRTKAALSVLVPLWRNAPLVRREKMLLEMHVALQAADAASDHIAEQVDPCLAKREPGEPMFVLLGRDSAAPAAMQKWCDERHAEIRDGRRPNTTEEARHIVEVSTKAAAFREWHAARKKPAAAIHFVAVDMPQHEIHVVDRATGRLLGKIENLMGAGDRAWLDAARGIGGKGAQNG